MDTFKIIAALRDLAEVAPDECSFTGDDRLPTVILGNKRFEYPRKSKPTTIHRFRLIREEVEGLIESREWGHVMATCDTYDGDVADVSIAIFFQDPVTFDRREVNGPIITDKTLSLIRCYVEAVKMYNKLASDDRMTIDDAFNILRSIVNDSGSNKEEGLKALGFIRFRVS